VQANLGRICSLPGLCPGVSPGSKFFYFYSFFFAEFMVFQTMNSVFSLFFVQKFFEIREKSQKQGNFFFLT
jgi:hypothetical protein